MKKLFLLSFLFAFLFGFSQDPADGWEISEVDGQTISACDGDFFDSGGFAENC